MTQKFQLLIQYGNTAAVHDDRLPQSTMTGLQLRHTATLRTHFERQFFFVHKITSFLSPSHPARRAITSLIL